ncbi:MAG TPA: DUF502 domain-containing protein [Verrucomicrobiota bacterium]|nr:DUF502 domain-containing protein [Verrucomicrobiota bacterium]HNU51551.1 DUF502 domain-containing protein [Verrucomicrobiota bacterium]
MKQSLMRWRANFVAGLVVILPAVISIAILKWLFGTVSSITDLLLFFVPRQITRAQDGRGDTHWYWSLLALAIGLLLVAIVGRAARNYVGRKLIQSVDRALSQVPLLNKIYSVVKQVNEAFSSTKKSSFKQVVLVEYPRRGIYSIGFITSDDVPEISNKLQAAVASVFIPTTPNPTTGFLLVVPRNEVIRLDMPVSDGIKYLISLGSVVPVYSFPAGSGAALPTPPAAPPAPGSTGVS